MRDRPSPYTDEVLAQLMLDRQAHHHTTSAARIFGRHTTAPVNGTIVAVRTRTHEVLVASWDGRTLWVVQPAALRLQTEEPLLPCERCGLWRHRAALCWSCAATLEHRAMSPA